MVKLQTLHVWETGSYIRTVKKTHSTNVNQAFPNHSVTVTVWLNRSVLLQPFLNIPKLSTVNPTLPCICLSWLCRTIYSPYKNLKQKHQTSHHHLVRSHLGPATSAKQSAPHCSQRWRPLASTTGSHKEGDKGKGTWEPEMGKGTCSSSASGSQTSFLFSGIL